MAKRNYTSRPKRSQTTFYKDHYRKLFKTLILGVIILVLMYFWLVGIMSNIDNFWQIFRGRDEPATRNDTIAPPPPFYQKLPEAVNETHFSIEGYSEAFATVAVYINERQIESTLASEDGSFTIFNIPLQETASEIYLTATDKAGNRSGRSKVSLIHFDDEEPTLKITAPAGNESIRRKERAYTITGQTDPDSKVLVNDQQAAVDYEGSFSITVSLKDGDNYLKIEAVDKADNRTKAERTINFEKTD